MTLSAYARLSPERRAARIARAAERVRTERAEARKRGRCRCGDVLRAWPDGRLKAECGGCAEARTANRSTRAPRRTCGRSAESLRVRRAIRAAQGNPDRAAMLLLVETPALLAVVRRLRLRPWWEERYPGTLPGR